MLRPRSVWKTKKNSSSHAQGHSTAQLSCWGPSGSALERHCPSFLFHQCQVGAAPRGRTEGAAWSFISASLHSFFFLNRHHSVLRGTSASLCLLATCLLYWPTAALMVPPEVADGNRTLTRVRSEGGQLSSSWAYFPLVPVIPRTHYLPVPFPRTLSAPALPALGTALGGEAQLSLWDFPSLQ